MARTSKLSAIVHARCPRCRRGNMFSGPMYGFRLQHTNELCPRCGLRFEIEPGYFYAAMYISYAMNVAQMVNIGILTYLITGKLDFEYVWLYIATIIGGCLLLHHLITDIRVFYYYIGYHQRCITTFRTIKND